MTQEQIKQNAWNDLGRYTPCDENEWIDGYIVGAHSRDVEVEQLKAELTKAKNPWRDTQTDSPKEGQEVFAHVPNLCGGEYCKLTYLGDCWWRQDEGEWTTGFYNNEVLWMPIPYRND